LLKFGLFNVLVALISGSLEVFKLNDFSLGVILLSMNLMVLIFCVISLVNRFRHAREKQKWGRIASSQQLRIIDEVMQGSSLEADKTLSDTEAISFAMVDKASLAVDDDVEMLSLNSGATPTSATAVAALASASRHHAAFEKERDREARSLKALKSHLLEASSIVLIKRVGAGAFGEVYKGTYQGSVVAVKTMIDVTTDTMKLFRAEVRCLQKTSRCVLGLGGTRFVN
jgi:hypothetical protein